MKYPWNLLKPGEGFFLPCLDLEKERELALRSANSHKLNVKCQKGIFKGMLGLWLYRPPTGPASRTPS